MSADRDALRALLVADDEFDAVCEHVLTVLEHSERLVETLNFNTVDVTVDQQQHVITVEGILSIHDETLHFSEGDFRTLASEVAKPMSGKRLDTWRTLRARDAWPMGPASD